MLFTAQSFAISSFKELPAARNGILTLRTVGGTVRDVQPKSKAPFLQRKRSHNN